MSRDRAASDRLEIPSLGIGARLAVAEIREGEYAVPRDPAVVGVHRANVAGLGPRLAPHPGTLLLAGHVTSGRVRGALWPLHSLEPGAELVVGGRRWRAVRLDVHRADALPHDLVRGDGPERLVVVTCTGPIIGEGQQRAYRDNLVVTAVPV